MRHVAIGDLRSATQAGDSVWVSGWLMFDPLHYDQMWQYDGPSDTSGTKARITLWEIHPITRIEVCSVRRDTPSGSGSSSGTSRRSGRRRPIERASTHSTSSTEPRRSTLYPMLRTLSSATRTSTPPSRVR